MKIKCFLGFHKWGYGEKFMRTVKDGFPNIVRRTRTCKECGKYQELKVAPPDYSLIEPNFEWQTIKTNEAKDKQAIFI